MPQLQPTKNGNPRVYQGAGGAVVPSVTQVLDILNDSTWMNHVLQKKGRRELDRISLSASTLGTKIHAVADKVAWDRGYVPDDEILAPYATALRDFLNAHVRRVIATELSLVSEREHVGGTCDMVAEMTSGHVAVLDWKSRKNGGVKNTDRCQLAAYALLLREHGYPVQKRIVVRLHTSEGKEGKLYARTAADHEGDVRAFRACRDIWYWRYGHRLVEKGKKSA